MLLACFIAQLFINFFLIFCIIFVSEKQEEKIDPMLQWVESEFGFKPVTYSSFFVGKQEEGLTKEIEILLKKTNDCQLASIDAMAAAAHSLIIPLAIFRGRLGIEEAIELIRLEEDHQVWIYFVLFHLLFVWLSFSVQTSTDPNFI